MLIDVWRLQVNRMVNMTATIFGDQLRGTTFLIWWFRALVRPALPSYAQQQDVQPNLDYALSA